MTTAADDLLARAGKTRFQTVLADIDLHAFGLLAVLILFVAEHRDDGDQKANDEHQDVTVDRHLSSALKRSAGRIDWPGWDSDRPDIPRQSLS